MSLDPTLGALTRSCQTLGIPPEEPLAQGAALLAHAQRLGQPPEAWLGPLERYVLACHAQGLSVWSPLHFVVPQLMALCGASAERFSALLEETGQLLTSLEKRQLGRTRTEQYGLRLALEALPAGTPEGAAAFRALLALSRALVQAGADPGWTLQFLPGPLWRAAQGSLTTFAAAVQALQGALHALVELQMGAVYPVAVGLAALAEHRGWTLTLWQSWLGQVVRIARAECAAGAPPFGWFEHALGRWQGCADWSGEDVSLALETSLLLADRALLSGDAIRQAPGLTLPETLAITARLATEGVNPLWLVSRALDSVEPLWSQRGQAVEAADRLAELALELSAHGLPLRNLFEEGFAVLSSLENALPGTFERGLALAETMATAGMDPDLTVRYGVPRALRDAPPGSWIPDAVLTFAEALVAQGLLPDAALSYAVPPLLMLAKDSHETFVSLTGTLASMMQALREVGIDPRDVLFHDVDVLASAGAGTSQAFATTLSGTLAVLQAYARAKVDPHVLLTQALPGAARACKGRPRALALALETVEQSAAHGEDGAAFLSFALPVLVQQSHGDDGYLGELIAVVRPRMQQLGNEAGALLGAALSLSEVRASALEATLQALVEHLPGAPEARREVAHALPALVGIASNARELGQLMDAIAQQLPVIASPPMRRVWLAAGLQAIRVLLPHRAAEALSLIPRLATQVAAWDGEAAESFPDAVLAAARNGEGQSDRFLDDLIAVQGVLTRLGKQPRNGNHRLRLLFVLEQRGRPAAFRERVGALMSLLERTPAEEQGPFLLNLFPLSRWVESWPGTWDDLIVPLLKMHVRQATQVLWALTELPLEQVRQASDLDTLREIVTQTGTQAADVVRHLIGDALRSGALRDLTAQRGTLRGFIRDVAIWDEQLFREYDRLQTGARTETERRAAVGQLHASFSALRSAIRSGHVTTVQETDPFFAVSLSYVFPPATSVRREAYRDLYAQFPDRGADIDRLELPEGLRRFPVTLRRSSWQLLEAAPDLEPLRPTLEALRDAANAREEDSATLGWRFLTAWASGRIGRAEPRAELLAHAVRRLPDHVELGQPPETAAQLLKLRELLSERLLHTVEESLLAAREQDPERYRRMLEEKLAPRPVLQRRFLRAVRQALSALREGRLSREEALARLGGQLDAFAFDPATHLDPMSALATEAELGAFLEALGPRPFELDPGKEVSRVHGDWVGQDARRLKTLLFGEGAQRGILVEEPASARVTWSFELTKRRAHAPVGLSEGVCVAFDRELWNRPDFWQVVFWDEHDRCQGGMHLLKVVEGGRGYLALPGINPSVNALLEFHPATWLDATLEYAWRLARQLKLTEVWVPAAPYIHSNRSALHAEISERRWATRRTANHPFSYSPYAYAFSEVLLPPVPAANRPE